MNEVKEYYNSIATDYDHDRFANSYGKFIDTEERIILHKWLDGIDKKFILDYGCGTGRLTNFATIGADISEAMLSIAKQKNPEIKFHLIQDNHLDIKENSLSAVYSFHVIMHLTPAEFKQMATLIHEKLTDNGLFIFDILSKKRKPTKKGWHANTSYSLNEIEKEIGHQFEITTYNGILFFPIHRIPTFLRNYFLWLDIFLCSSFLKRFSSYYCILAKKK